MSNSDTPTPSLTTLPLEAYTTDRSAALTEPLDWYGPGKLHPTHLHDTLSASSSRYRIAHKLDHGPHALSWLARDTHAATWRRVDVVHAAPEVTAAYARAADAQLARRAEMGGDDDDDGAVADARGLAIDRFWLRGPNGTHLCIVWPLNGEMGGFRWAVRDRSVMDEAWFVRQCAKIRGSAEAKVGSVHEITEEEMLAILGRPRVIVVDEEMMREVGVSKEMVREGQVPRYLVVRPDKVEEDLEYWLSGEAFIKA
ncbi:hypothetical protein NEMBOFW57_009574 [Staphylotrichum longicolle]|uniref:Uncharacterized protein n=1 Tax=Staphylotrichum longicolle TaxID=669026 RepID=A0AAD4HXW0_9PEZI|nr:hypothetical protein NEMBOFW57_009574 [Staphylotrichum longicolle]